MNTYRGCCKNMVAKLIFKHLCHLMQLRYKNVSLQHFYNILYIGIPYKACLQDFS